MEDKTLESKPPSLNPWSLSIPLPRRASVVVSLGRMRVMFINESHPHPHGHTSRNRRIRNHLRGKRDWSWDAAVREGVAEGVKTVVGCEPHRDAGGALRMAADLEWLRVSVVRRLRAGEPLARHERDRWSPPVHPVIAIPPTKHALGPEAPPSTCRMCLEHRK